MKNKASLLVKHIISVLSSFAKPKIMGVRNKAYAMRARFLVFSLLKTKKLTSITNKIQALLDRNDSNELMEEDLVDNEEHNKKAIVLYDACIANGSHHDNHHDGHDDDDDDKYPDLTHCLFNEEDGMDDDQGGSIIEMVKNSKEIDGQDFILEDEIDHVADLFIKRFRKQMRLQKLESFKRYQDMLDRSV